MQGGHVGLEGGHVRHRRAEVGLLDGQAGAFGEGADAVFTATALAGSGARLPALAGGGANDSAYRRGGARPSGDVFRSASLNHGRLSLGSGRIYLKVSLGAGTGGGYP